MLLSFPLKTFSSLYWLLLGTQYTGKTLALPKGILLKRVFIYLWSRWFVFVETYHQLLVFYCQSLSNIVSETAFKEFLCCSVVRWAEPGRICLFKQNIHVPQGPSFFNSAVQKGTAELQQLLQSWSLQNKAMHEHGWGLFVAVYPFSAQSLGKNTANIETSTKGVLF